MTEQDNPTDITAGSDAAGAFYDDPPPLGLGATTTGTLDEATEAAILQLVDNAVPEYKRPKGARGRWNEQQTADQKANAALREDLLRRLRDGAIAANTLAATQRENIRLSGLAGSYEEASGRHRQRADRLERQIHRARDQRLWSIVCSRLGLYLGAEVECFGFDPNSETYRFTVRRATGEFVVNRRFDERGRVTGSLRLEGLGNDKSCEVGPDGLLPFQLRSIAEAYGPVAEAEYDASKAPRESQQAGAPEPVSVFDLTPSGGLPGDSWGPYTAHTQMPWQQGG